MGFAREVAVKLLKPEREDDQELLLDLLSEGAICAQLEHENIVHVHSVAEQAGTLVVEMELITGGTVLELIRRLAAVGLRIPRSAVLDIGIQVCAGLTYAWTGLRQDGEPFHIVHRDLKPANLLLTEHGEVRIADFGLAKRSGDPSTTAVGALKGTPSYSAPETFMEGKTTPTPGIDLFSLGCVLFELWTGRVLHGADTLPAVVTRIIMGDPAEDVAPVRREFPELAAITEELLQRDPEVRPGQPAVVRSRLADLRDKMADPPLSVLLELVGNLEAEERSTRKNLRTRDPDWQTLWRRVQQGGISNTTVIEQSSIEEAPPLATSTAQLPALEALEPVPQEPIADDPTIAFAGNPALLTAQEPIADDPTIAFGGNPALSPAKPPPRPSAKKPAPKRPSAKKPTPKRAPAKPPSRAPMALILGLVVVCLALLIGIVLVLRTPSAPPAPLTEGACLVLGSSPAGAQVWIDGVLAAPAGDHRGAARWAAPGNLTIAMGTDGAEVVSTQIEAPKDSATRVVCSVGDSPACLVAAGAPGACQAAVSQPEGTP